MGGNDVFRIAAILASIALSSSIIGTETLDSATPSDNAVQGFEDAAATQAGLYADMFNVSVPEAERRASLREEFGVLLQELSEEYADSFAGAVVEHEPSYRFVVYMTGSGEAAVERLGEQAEAAKLPLVVKEASLSLQQLEAQRTELHAVLVDDRGLAEVSSAVDVLSGRIQVTIGTASGDAASRSSGTPLPDEALEHNVDVVYVDAPVGTDDHTYGGALTTTGSAGTPPGCTTGFVVVNASSGARGVATAGHCANDRWYNMGSSNNYSMDYVNQHRGSWGDFQWHTTTHNHYDDFYWDWGSRRDVQSVQSASNIALGDIVCRFGRTTGSHCDGVYATNVSKTSNGYTYGRLVALGSRQADTGDSGGPWFNGATAWGLHQGSANVNGAARDVFSKADYIDEALGLGLSVATS
ncbi:MAG: S1 family peptidase [Intrasporangiaceae bacterium]|nr:S1 family peptidase [Intrasporangiaceae bacterium]